MSDQTHLSNFSGNNKAWPVYITLGNLQSARRDSLGSMVVLLLALLPVPPKFSKSIKAYQYQKQVNADTLQDAFEFIFAPLQHAALDGSGLIVLTGRFGGASQSCLHGLRTIWKT